MALRNARRSMMRVKCNTQAGKHAMAAVWFRRRFGTLVKNIIISIQLPKVFNASLERPAE